MPTLTDVNTLGCGLDSSLAAASSEVLFSKEKRLINQIAPSQTSVQGLLLHALAPVVGTAVSSLVRPLAFQALTSKDLSPHVHPLELD